jgi:hypothetical protein
MKKILVAVALTGLLVTGIAVAHPKHPNLAAAHNMVLKAIDHIDAAQKANEYDLGGHAAKAKDLLQQAETELRQAAEAANANDAKKQDKK